MRVTRPDSGKVRRVLACAFLTVFLATSVHTLAYAMSASVQAKYRACHAAQGFEIIEQCTPFIRLGSKVVHDNLIFSAENIRLGQAYMSFGQYESARKVFINLNDEILLSSVSGSQHYDQRDYRIFENYILNSIQLGIAYYNLGNYDAGLNALNFAYGNWQGLVASPGYVDSSNLQVEKKVHDIIVQFQKAKKATAPVPPDAPPGASPPASAPVDPLDACKMFPTMC